MSSRSGGIRSRPTRLPSSPPARKRQREGDGHLDFLKFKADLGLIEYLSTPTERLKWQGHALPSDDLCVENAIILQRFRRYPLVIDPAGHAIQFLKNLYAAQKMAVVSFLDFSPVSS